MSDVKVFMNVSLPKEGEISLYDDFIEHYLIDVRRLSEGDRFEIAGENAVVVASLTSTDPLSVTIESSRSVRTLEHDLCLYQAITRKQKFEESIKRGTELGVTKFVPVITDRTVRVPNNLDKQKRRWKKIATDSARISDRDQRPQIVKPVEFENIPKTLNGTIYLAGPDGEPSSEVFQEGMTEASLFVGPEGGFTEDEKQTLRSFSDATVRFGKRNLRAETASIALVTSWLDRTGNLR
jgi:16S rRNA (uracil1498-N3)-methyltransferase